MKFLACSHIENSILKCPRHDSVPRLHPTSSLKSRRNLPEIMPFLGIVTFSNVYAKHAGDQFRSSSILSTFTLFGQHLTKNRILCWEISTLSFLFFFFFFYKYIFWSRIQNNHLPDNICHSISG